ncbi:MAG: hypothetical protein R3321_07505 [Nitrososphaeraceae archaeon]|nr:hypothetical protein [Nitrososphaeraceae archaeon]
MNEYKPNYCSPPCETIKDWMVEHEVTFNNFLEKTGYETYELVDILYNNHRLTKQDCILLSEITGTSVKFWENRESQYVECIKHNRQKFLNSIYWVILSIFITAICLIWMILSY